MRQLIQFMYVKHHLPGLTAESACNARSAGTLDFLTHTGPDGRHWSTLWVDLDRLHKWAYFRNRTFSSDLKDAIQKRAVHADTLAQTPASEKPR